MKLYESRLHLRIINLQIFQLQLCDRIYAQLYISEPSLKDPLARDPNISTFLNSGNWRIKPVILI